VSGDKVWLRGTTLEEVEKYHRDTLLLALEAANTGYANRLALWRQREEAERERHEAHRKSVDEAARRITFD
jgi:hypothetical protein